MISLKVKVFNGKHACYKLHGYWICLFQNNVLQKCVAVRNNFVIMSKIIFNNEQNNFHNNNEQNNFQSKHRTPDSE